MNELLKKLNTAMREGHGRVTAKEILEELRQKAIVGLSEIEDEDRLIAINMQQFLKKLIEKEVHGEF